MNHINIHYHNMKDKTTTQQVLYIILFIAIFLLIQSIVQLLGIGLYAWISGEPYNVVESNLLSDKYSILITITSAISSLATIILFIRRKWTVVSNTYLTSRPWLVLLWSCLLSVGSILPLEFIYEKINLQLPEYTQQLFEGIIKEPWGYLAIGILAPVAEEVVFRGAILRTLLISFGKQKHWIAIVLSALIFGLIHFNIAQGVHAFLMGLLLGWMYYRTYSIIPGIALHWVNNTIAFIMYHLMPQMGDGKLINFFHGNETLMYGGLFFSLCIFIPSLLQLAFRMKPANP